MSVASVEVVHNGGGEGVVAGLIGFVGDEAAEGPQLRLKGIERERVVGRWNNHDAVLLPEGGHLVGEVTQEVLADRVGPLTPNQAGAHRSQQTNEDSVVLLRDPGYRTARRAKVTSRQ